MPDILEILRLNLFSPTVLAFALGVVAVTVRSDLKVPEPVAAALSIYLLFAIGLKGGVALAKAQLAEILLPAVAALAIGLAIPVWCFAILRWLGRFGTADAAALAAHYGSVSAVTFIAGLAYLDAQAVAYEGFLPALVALLEVPAIVVAILLARLGQVQAGAWRETLGEVLAGKSIVLLVGGLVIGWLSGPAGYAKVAPFFADPFQGILALFLLEMGLVAGRRLRDVRAAGTFLVGFAVVMPLVHGALGVVLGQLAGLSAGGAMILGLMAASASYIAAPAAIRVALPEASPGLYLTASLALTFPFNLVVGLPVYWFLTVWLYGGGTG